LSLSTKFSTLTATIQEDNPSLDWVVQIMDSNFFSALFAVLGVIVGAWLTHKYSLKSKISEDNRERLLASVMDALQHADDLLDNFKDFAYNAPRGGGRIRPSDNPEAEWIKIPRKEAKEHDRNAANAIARMHENTEMLRKLNVQLSVFSPPELVHSFQQIPEFVTNFLQKTVEGGGQHKGQLAADALEGMQNLFDEALKQTVELAEVKFKTVKKR